MVIIVAQRAWELWKQQVLHTRNQPTQPELRLKFGEEEMGRARGICPLGWPSLGWRCPSEELGEGVLGRCMTAVSGGQMIY